VNPLPPEWEIYMEELLPDTGPLLDRVEQYTRWHTPYPQMISGKWQAAFLHFLVRLRRPLHVLEIGTFTGYATLAMAHALPDDARLVTLENRPENARIARKFIRECSKSVQIEFVETDALVWLEQNAQMFDFVYLDAAKEDYPRYFSLVKHRLRPGAWWITDNVLWNGKVLNPGRDKQASAIARFNRMVKDDPQLMNMLIPLRDGLMWTVYNPEQ